MKLNRPFNRKWFITPLIIALLAVLVPTAIVFAIALKDPTIAMNGVNDSQLTVGMHATDDSTRLMDTGFTPTIFTPSSNAGQMLIVIVLVFIAFSILLILYLVETKRHPIYILLTIAILIYTALALLPIINSMVNNLLGY